MSAISIVPNMKLKKIVSELRKIFLLFSIYDFLYSFNCIFCFFYKEKRKKSKKESKKKKKEKKERKKKRREKKEKKRRKKEKSHKKNKKKQISSSSSSDSSSSSSESEEDLKEFEIWVEKKSKLLISEIFFRGIVKIFFIWTIIVKLFY